MRILGKFGPPDLRIPGPNLPSYGDPLARIITDSNGPGGGAGIGTGSGGGIGSGVYNAGTGGYGVPSCIYCPDPSYSQAARDAKFMGTVLLKAVITADGRAVEIQVVKDPGMGLGEKAMEAVQAWQFRPAIGPNGKPAATLVTIQVAFRLK